MHPKNGCAIFGQNFENVDSQGLRYSTRVILKNLVRHSTRVTTMMTNYRVVVRVIQRYSVNQKRIPNFLNFNDGIDIKFI